MHKSIKHAAKIQRIQFKMHLFSACRLSSIIHPLSSSAEGIREPHARSEVRVIACSKMRVSQPRMLCICSRKELSSLLLEHLAKVKLFKYDVQHKIAKKYQFHSILKKNAVLAVSIPPSDKPLKLFSRWKRYRTSIKLSWFIMVVKKGTGFFLF